MHVPNETLTAIGLSLGKAIEKSYEPSQPKRFAIDIATAQALFAITQELIAFRLDYPDVVYQKSIEDVYGVRGEQ